MKPLAIVPLAPVILLALALTVPAFAQSATESTGVNTLLGIAPKTADFVKEAATSDMFEIASSKLAVERGDAATKAFAQQMVTDHQKTTEELKELVSSGKVKATLPTAMTSKQQSMLDKVERSAGRRLPKAISRRPGIRAQGRRRSVQALWGRRGKS